MSIEAMKQMVEALESNHEEVVHDWSLLEKNKQAIQAGLKAIAEAEKQEPVLWAAKESIFMWGKSDEDGHPYHIVCKGKKVQSHQIPLYTHPQPKAEQEPVAWYCKDGLKRGVSLRQENAEWTPLYITPQRTWVGLDTDEFKFIASKYLLNREVGLEYFQEEIEAKLKEKNT